MNNVFFDVADVLEKTAQYIENEEASKTAQETQSKLKEANVLAEKISEATGQIITDDLVEKLSNAAPDIKALIGSITDTDTVDSLGGPVSGHNKEASVTGETGSAEQALLDFLSS